MVIFDSKICLFRLSTSAPAKLGERPAFFSVHVDSYDNLKMARMFLDLCSAVTALVNIIVCNNTLLVNTVIQENSPQGIKRFVHVVMAASWDGRTLDSFVPRERLISW